MIDVETLGSRAGCVMTEFAGLAFNMSDDAVDALYVNIDLQSSLDQQFFVEASTLKWWVSTHSGMLAEVLTSKNSVHPRDFCESLKTWWIDVSHEDTLVWANGTHFDVAIVEAYFARNLLSLPWRYNKARDYRTIAHPLFDGIDLGLDDSQFTVHDPVQDCERQVAKLKAMWARLTAFE
jgi:hypothetical protein